MKISILVTVTTGDEFERLVSEDELNDFRRLLKSPEHRHGTLVLPEDEEEPETIIPVRHIVSVKVTR